MKKYLLTTGFALLTSIAMAMDAPNDDEKLTPPLNLQPINVKQEIDLFRTNSENYEVKGGIPGLGIFSASTVKMGAVESLLAMHSDNYNLLLKQLEVANEQLRNMAAVSRALEEAQKQRDIEAKKRQEAEEHLHESSITIQLLKRSGEAILLESSQKDITIRLNEERKELLENKNKELKQILLELAENAHEIETLLNDNKLYEMNPSLINSSKIEETTAALKRMMEKNLKRISELRARNNSLEKSKEETKETIEQLNQALEANDYYTQILKRINDKSIPDDNLALFIFSVCNMQGMDLDELSKDRDERLIEALIKVSRPEQQKPKESEYEKARRGGKTNFSKYENRFRLLGNLFVPGGLTWIGEPLDLTTCIYEGSEFAKSAGKMAKTAKQQLSQPQNRTW